jgi:hypothetical protein
MLMRCCGWTQLSESLTRSITYRTAETLKETIYAARRARCPVTCLKIRIFASLNQPMHMELDAAMRRILDSSLAPLNVDLCRRNTRRISYDHESQCLKFQSIHYDDSSHNIMNLALCWPYTWLLAQKITQVRIVDDDKFQVSRFQPFFSPHLKRLTIHGVVLRAGHFNQNLCSELIDTISGLSSLQYCEIGDLTYRLSLIWDDENDVACLALPDGRKYPYPGEVTDFRLLYSAGAATIELDGGETCRKLQDLASYVRAAEHNKRQKIMREGFVSDNMVEVIEE